MMYETIPGIVETVDPPSSENIHLIQATVRHVMIKAWDLAIRRMKELYGYDEDAVTDLIETERMISVDIPKWHKSFSQSHDVARGWIGAMINDEFKLIASYAVQY